jgi:hypothetical protein
MNLLPHAIGALDESVSGAVPNLQAHIQIIINLEAQVSVVAPDALAVRQRLLEKATAAAKMTVSMVEEAEARLNPTSYQGTNGSWSCHSGGLVL